MKLPAGDVGGDSVGGWVGGLGLGGVGLRCGVGCAVGLAIEMELPSPSSHYVPPPCPASGGPDAPESQRHVGPLPQNVAGEPLVQPSHTLQPVRFGDRVEHAQHARAVERAAAVGVGRLGVEPRARRVEGLHAAAEEDPAHEARGAVGEPVGGRRAPLARHLAVGGAARQRVGGVREAQVLGVLCCVSGLKGALEPRERAETVGSS